MDREAWHATVHGVPKNRTWLSDWTDGLHVCGDPHKGFSTVNEAEGDVFLEFPCFLYDSTNIGNLISGSSAFSKPSLYIWKFLAYVLLKPNLKDFEHSLTSMWNEHNCPVVWTFFYTALLWDWDEKWLTFSSPVVTAEFSKFADTLSAALLQHHLLGF